MKADNRKRFTVPSPTRAEEVFELNEIWSATSAIGPDQQPKKPYQSTLPLESSSLT